MNNFRLLKSSKHFFYALVLMVITSACDVVVRPYASGDTLLVDDFESHRVAWKTWQNPGVSSASYLDGGFALVVDASNLDVISINEVNFKDAVIEVIARKAAGSDDNQFGLVCRYQDNDNYYAFSVTSDGYYGIYKVEDGNYSLLSSNSLQYSEKINQGDQENIIKADCLENLLGLTVNGQQLALATDNAFTYGQTGLMAGTFDDPELAVIFDNFTVTYP